MILCLELFRVFFIIGMFTFGGGYAIMSLIQSEIVFGRAWIDESTFTDIVAISQITPGPIGLNCSTYVGYEVMRAAGYGQVAATTGSLIASLAIVLPSFIIVLAIARFYVKAHENTIFKAAMDGLKPAVVGLIGAAGLTMMFHITACGTEAFAWKAPEQWFNLSLSRDNFSGWDSWVIFAAAFIASMRKKSHPVRILLIAAIAGLFI